MNRTHLHIILACLFCCCMSSCHSSFCRYAWDRGTVAEGTWILSPDEAELYQVGNEVYVKGEKGLVRGYYKEFPPFYIFGRRLITTQENHTIENEVNTPVYFKVHDSAAQKILSKKSRVYWLADNRKTMLTELPPDAMQLDRTGRRIKRKIPHINIKQSGAARPDAHALYYYPLGLVTAVVVDVPCTVSLNIAGAVAGVLSLPYYIYQSLK